MGRPITTTKGGICFAFPNVCLTQVGPVTVPIPYPSIGQISDAGGTSKVMAGGSNVVRKADSIPSTTGDSAGQAGVTSGTVGGKVEFMSHSATVKAEGSEVVRMFDQTKQNDGNAVGIVLGGFPTVLVGG
ncbi:DUF4150 domain-containing protein [Paracoccus sediminis]|uniref:DUF4150 domain-containing protein n=1 Tax=Paracoccus sediminis TaxID=1214787 RepID=A0A238WXZ4_9RHOB|nr:DUF4150 domain-containing protein [Paracoccus sediminis]TBN50113.1 DUF4150 domain-containing protein [Paracoccus sediminis]SNR51221.1 protein of unknown function [Paracoccus sediminis]